MQRCYKCNKEYATVLSLQTHIYRTHNDYPKDIDDPYISHYNHKFNRGGMLDIEHLNQ